MPQLLSRVVRVALCLGFLSMPGLASAEPLPIEWSYTAHMRTSTGLGVLDFGTHSLWSDPTGSGGGGEFNNYKITSPFPEMNLSGSSSVSGEPIHLGYIGYPYSVDPVESAPAADPGFLLTFTLTDTASGQSATLEFGGSGGASTSNEFPPSVLFVSAMGPQALEVQLGQNRYRVTSFGGVPDELGEPAQFGVRVEATALTPEPATFAMAGFGIAAIGLIRARRVKPHSC